MGYYRDSHPGHEGFAVGLTVRDERLPENSNLYRELCYPGDDEPRCIEMVQAGCECGWRSPHWKPDRSTKQPAYSPYSVGLTKGDDAKVRDLWSEHLEHTPS